MTVPRHRPVAPVPAARRLGLARQRGPLPRLQPGRGGDGPAPTRPTCCTSTTGTPAPSSPPSRRRRRRVLTLHNVAYQGVTDGELAAPASDRAAGTTSGGAAPTRCRARIALADAVVAVSPAPRRRDPHAGRRLRARRAAAQPRRRASSGIRNGIDTGALGPGDRPRTSRRRFAADDRGRARAATAAQPAGAARPLRLARRRHAAGRDGDAAHRPEGRRHARARSCPCCATCRCAWSCSASARRRWPQPLAGLAADHPASFAFVERYDEPLAHLLFGGGDVFLMPSRFEPCGLAQMQAMRYGAIPVVTPVGGLRRHRARRRRRRRTATASSPTASTPSASCRRCSAPPGCSPTGAAASRSSGGSWGSTGRGATPAAEYVELYDAIAPNVRRARRPLGARVGSAAMAAEPHVLVIVLAGGEGKRLLPLTNDRAKPAVPFGGCYRLIDFALSNFANARYLKIVVLTQYKSHSLDRHISQTWRFSTLLDDYVTPVPAQMRRGPVLVPGLGRRDLPEPQPDPRREPRHRLRVRRRPHLPDGPAPDGRPPPSRSAPA